MTMITKLRARVSPEAISKVTRIFNGTLDDIFNELFENLFFRWFDDGLFNSHLWLKRFYF